MDRAMGRYPALIDGRKGAYGVTFPDLPGIVAMGKTVDEAMVNAEEALRDYAIEAEKDGEAITPPSDPAADGNVKRIVSGRRG